MAGQPGAVMAARPAEAAEAGLAQAEPLAPAAVDEIVHQVRLTSVPGHTSLRLQLRPDWLGEVEVRLDVTARGTSVHFVTATPEAQAALERQLPSLRAALETSGIAPDALSLSSGAAGAGLGGNTGFNLAQQGLPQRYEGPAPMAPSGGAVTEAATESSETTGQARPARPLGLIDYRA
jgi:hypothetical protein